MEAILDRELEELDRLSARFGNNVFEGLRNSSELRPGYESVAKRYLKLLVEKGGSQTIPLKILTIMDRLRAPDVARKRYRTRPIGPPTRKSFSPQSVADDHLNVYFQASSGTNRRRSFREAGEMNFAHHEPDIVLAEDMPHEGESASGKTRIDFSKTIVIHFGFIGEDLIVFLDTNLDRYIYGVEKNDKINSRSFAEYGYDWIELDHEKIIVGPLISRNAKSRIRKISEEFLANICQCDAFVGNDVFHDFMAEIDNLLLFEKLEQSILQWANESGLNSHEIQLMIAPDDILFLLPLTFLGASHNRPFVTSFDGVAITLGMMPLKWNIQVFHWTTSCNLTQGRPRCTLFADSGDPQLDLSTEIKSLQSEFGKDSIMTFGPMTLREEFIENYSAAEICWFMGHGAFDLSQYVQQENTQIPFPLSGPAFFDGIISNWDLISTSNFNFETQWLTVLNCCVLGKSVIEGPNPLGFISALHSVGCTSVVVAGWEVLNSAAEKFAAVFAKNLIMNYSDAVFGKSKALSETIKELLEKNPNDQWLYAPYALWGLP